MKLVVFLIRVLQSSKLGKQSSVSSYDYFTFYLLEIASNMSFSLLYLLNGIMSDYNLAR